MLGSRTLNVPAVAFALAVVVGVLARNVPQRGGSLRIEPKTGSALCLGNRRVVVFFACRESHHHRARAGSAPSSHASVRPGCRGTRTSSSTTLLFWTMPNPVCAKRWTPIPTAAPDWLDLAWLTLEEPGIDRLRFNICSQQADILRARRWISPPLRPAHCSRAASPVCSIIASPKRSIRQAGPRTRALRQQVQYYAVAILALRPANRSTVENIFDYSA